MDGNLERYSRFHNFVEGYCNLWPYIGIFNKKTGFQLLIKLKNPIKNNCWKGLSEYECDRLF